MTDIPDFYQRHLQDLLNRRRSAEVVELLKLRRRRKPRGWTISIRLHGVPTRHFLCLGGTVRAIRPVEVLVLRDRWGW